jgi:hypothetical protein
MLLNSSQLATVIVGCVGPRWHQELTLAQGRTECKCVKFSLMDELNRRLSVCLPLLDVCSIEICAYNYT